MRHAVAVFARQRHEMIVDSVQRNGSMRVRELAALLEVSEMTVRRDLDLLAGQGLIEKVHGGATRVADRSTDEPGFEAKQRRQLNEKQDIARAALELIQPGSAIGLTAGTTTWALANLLGSVSDLTVVTNSPSIAQVLYHSPQLAERVVLTGGTRTPSDALVGPVATAALSRLHIDTLFMGVHGMDEHGFSTPNLREAEMNQAFVRSARKAVVLADHTKWGIQGLATIVELDEVETVISDQKLAPDAQAHFADLGETELVLADPRPNLAIAAEGG